MAERRPASSVKAKQTQSSKSSRRKRLVEPAPLVAGRPGVAIEIEAKPLLTVATYVSALKSPQREIAEKLLRIVRDAAPKAIESVKAGHPLLEHRGPLCSVIACGTHVSLGFFAVGCTLSDPDHLLEGTGECARQVKFRALSEIRAGQLAAWVRKAVEFNEDA